MSKQHLTTLCDHDQPECPKIYVDRAESIDRQVSIADDFGKTIYISKNQFRLFVEQAKMGAFDI